MLKKTKGFITGFICCIMIFAVAGTVFASSNTINASITFKDIKLVVDGVLFTPKDVDGNVVEPFIYNGSTYLPVRAVGEALGKAVDWDGETSTVYIGDKPGAPEATQKKYLGVDLAAYQSNRTEISQNVKMGGTTYGNAIVFNPLGIIVSGIRGMIAECDFNLNGEYSTISGKVGKVDGAGDVDAVMNIYGDQKLIMSLDLKTFMFGDDISFSVAGVRQLKIEVIPNENKQTSYALVGMELIK